MWSRSSPALRGRKGLLPRCFLHLGRETEMNYRATAVLIAAGWMAGCTVGPNYRRPVVQAPQAFRAPDPLPARQAESFADLKWWEIFKDADLQQLVRTALQQNYDLRDAVARVEAARANLGITRSDQFPQVGVSGDL